MSSRIKLPEWITRSSLLVGSAMMFCGSQKASAAAGSPPAIRSISIVLDEKASPVEQRIVEVFKNRILSNTPVSIEVATKSRPGVDLSIYLGRLRSSGALNELCGRENVRPPGKVKANPE